MSERNGNKTQGKEATSFSNCFPWWIAYETGGGGCIDWEAKGEFWYEPAVIQPYVTLALMWRGGATEINIRTRSRRKTPLDGHKKWDPRGSTFGTWCLANRKSLEHMTDWLTDSVHRESLRVLPPSPELNIILFAASLANDTKPEETIFKRLESGITDSTHTQSVRDGWMSARISLFRRLTRCSCWPPKWDHKLIAFPFLYVHSI